MDDETPEMEAITSEMREVMRAWIADPDNTALKQRYTRLQAAYQHAFLELKQSGREPPGGEEAVHQAY
jgi:GTP cyclohydrolase I